MKTLYLDCFAGIAGDMFLGAVLNLGIDREKFLSQMSKLCPGDFHIEISEQTRGGISGTKVNVISMMESHDHNDSHHEHEEEHSTGYHIHRHLADILSLIQASGLSEEVKQKSSRAFSLLAEAEASVHGTTPDQIHFHEVGAVDSIADIVGAFVAVEMLAPDHIVSSPVNVGGGTIHCAHGVMPVPAPATTSLLKGIPVFSKGSPIERTTPTGALLLKTMAESFGPIPDGTITGNGFGFGDTITEDIPNVLRVLLLDSSSAEKPYRQGRIAVLECNLDDMNPQDYGPLMERLFVSGALDVFLTPIFMKKQRPGVRISVICSPDKREELGKLILSGSTSIGLRWRIEDRMTLDRHNEMFHSSLGDVSFKVSLWGADVFQSTPEFDDLKRLSVQTGIPLPHLRTLIIAEYLKNKEA